MDSLLGCIIKRGGCLKILTNFLNFIQIKDNSNFQHLSFSWIIIQFTFKCCFACDFGPLTKTMLAISNFYALELHWNECKLHYYIYCIKISFSLVIKFAAFSWKVKSTKWWSALCSKEEASPLNVHCKRLATCVKGSV